MLTGVDELLSKEIVTLFVPSFYMILPILIWSAKTPTGRKLDNVQMLFEFKITLYQSQQNAFKLFDAFFEFGHFVF